MLDYVRVTKRLPALPGLPDPAKASTPLKAARMEAVNMTILDTSDADDFTTSQRGVKR